MLLIGERLNRQQPRFVGAVGAGLAVLAGMVLVLFPAGKVLRDFSYDFPFLVRKEKAVEDVVIVYLDEKSYATLHEDPFDFNRSLHAQLVSKLTAAGAKLIVFDILFIDQRRLVAEPEQQLADAIRSSGKVVLAGQYHQ